MLTKNLFPIVVLLLCASLQAKTQSITGVWEGIMEDEYLQVNIQQKGNELCGYTYDYVLEDRSSYCIARFTGSYAPDEKRWYITGTSFIANSGSHILMKLCFWHNPMESSNRELDAVLLMRGGINTPISEPFQLKKVSNSPVKMPKWANMGGCFVEHPKNKDITKAEPIQKPKPPRKVPVEKNTPPAPKKSPTTPPEEKKLPPVKEQIPIIREKKPDAPAEILKNMTKRKQTEQSHLTVNTRKINLKLYDNGSIDNDSVSVFYNNKLLVSHQKLSATPIELNIDLDPTVKRHEITLYAENLGSIPPNTALIVVTAGNKRYELHSSASLEENAVLVFDYVPDGKSE